MARNSHEQRSSASDNASETVRFRRLRSFADSALNFIGVSGILTSFFGTIAYLDVSKDGFHPDPERAALVGGVTLISAVLGTLGVTLGETVSESARTKKT